MSDIIEFQDGAPGGIIQKDDAWYFADREYLTNSMLSELQKSPLHLKQYIDGIRRPDTEAFVWGSAFHCLLLEPQDFMDRFYVFDDSLICQEIGGKVPRNTKKYKEWKEIIIDEARDRSMIDQSDYDSMRYIRDKILTMDEIKEMLNACAKEMIMADEIDGVKRKIKADAISYGNFIIDVKTTSSPVSSFRKSFYNYDYDRQMAYYKDVAKVNRMFILAVEKSSPYMVGWFEVSDEALDAGQVKHQHLFEQYKRDFLQGGITNFDKYYYRGYL